MSLCGVETAHHLKAKKTYHPNDLRMVIDMVKRLKSRNAVSDHFADVGKMVHYDKLNTGLIEIYAHGEE